MSTNARGIVVTTPTTTSTNQLYDAAGNVLNDGQNLYAYDAEGRICAVNNLLTGVLTGYVYDADGMRVAKGTIRSMSCDPTTNGLQMSQETDYILGPSGEQVTEVPLANLPAWHSNVLVGGQVLATFDAQGTHFYLNDWLDSRRVQVSTAGTVEQTCTNLPFGDGLNCSQSNFSPTEHHFTGKERDAESGNDYFGARYYASTMGRFLSPDWSAIPWPVPYSDLTNPQSLNLYAYGANNPLRFKDLDGHWHQNCDGSASMSQTATATVVNGTPCTSEPDFWDYQWWGNHARSSANQTWNNTKQAWNNAAKFARSPRGRLLGKSIKHLTIGGLKAGTAVAGVAAAPETGGASLALTVYGGVGATGDLTAGGSELLASIFASDSDLAGASNAGDAVADITTVSGATTLVVTGGNIDAANHAAAIEDIVVTGGTAGFTGDAPKLGDLLGLGDDTQDLSSSPNN